MQDPCMYKCEWHFIEGMANGVTIEPAAQVHRGLHGCLQAGPAEIPAYLGVSWLHDFSV